MWREIPTWAAGLYDYADGTTDVVTTRLYKTTEGPHGDELAVLRNSAQ
jgi:hypothetical protein